LRPAAVAGHHRRVQYYTSAATACNKIYDLFYSPSLTLNPYPLLTLLFSWNYPLPSESHFLKLKTYHAFFFSYSLYFCRKIHNARDIPNNNNDNLIYFAGTKQLRKNTSSFIKSLRDVHGPSPPPYTNNHRPTTTTTAALWFTVPKKNLYNTSAELRRPTTRTWRGRPDARCTFEKPYRYRHSRFSLWTS